MTYLADELKKHYCQRNNKLLFRSNKSLNQISLEVWEALDYKNFDSSILSKVINGKRLLSFKQLKALSRLLGLSNKDEHILKQSLAKDILMKNNLDGTLSFRNISFTDIQYFVEITKYVNFLRKNGFPLLAVDLSNLFENFLTNKNLFTKKEDNDKKLTILTTLLLEKGRAMGEIYPPELLESVMMPIGIRALNYARQLKNQSMLEMAYMNIGGCMYVSNKWQDSNQYLNTKLNKVGDNMRLEFYRTILLNLAYVNDILGFKKILKKSFSLLDKMSLKSNNVIGSYFEAIARAFCIFGNIAEAKVYLSNAARLNLDPFYRSQIIRCKAVLLQKESEQSNKINHDIYDELASQIINPIYTQYTRHQYQIRLILDKISNKFL